MPRWPAAAARRTGGAARGRGARQAPLAPPAAPRRAGTPARQALVCPYCGTVSPAELAARRHDSSRSTTWRWRCARFPTARAAGSANARRCSARAARRSRSSSPTRVAQRCEFCGSPAVVPYRTRATSSTPRACCRSRSAKPRCASRFAAGTRAGGSRPNRLKTAALTDRVRGVYLPYWTFDAQVHARWTAEAGHYYYETRMRQPQRP